MLDAPVEWVQGDLRWPRRWRLLRTAVWIGLLGSLLILSTHDLLVSFGGLPGSVWLPVGSILMLAPWPALLLVITLLAILPGRLPVAGPIGISPRGLSIPLFRKYPLPWSLVRWIDATHIYVGLDLGSQRVELTPYQAARIRHFFGQA